MHAVTLTIDPWLDNSQSAPHIIADRKVRCGPVTHDPEGCGIKVARALPATREGTRRLRAPAVRPQSRVGAGDSMVAGIAYGLMRGNRMHDAALPGIAAGAAAVMTTGTQLFDKADFERVLADILADD